MYKTQDAYLNLSLSLSLLCAKMGSADKAISYSSALVLSLLLLLLPLLHEAEGCDMFTGRWVEDASYPLYDPSTCPFIRREFACKRNGRPDLDYPTFRWQPQGCKLARYHQLTYITFIYFLDFSFVVSRYFESRYRYAYYHTRSQKISCSFFFVTENFLFLLLKF